MYSDTKCNQKNMKECDKRNSHISSKLHMIDISSNNDGHPLTKTFTPPHFTTLHPTTLHFNNFKLWHPRCVLITVHKEWYQVV